MSEPKRYAIRGFSAALVEEDNGVFIRYEDYARLKAEVELWEKNTQLMGRQLNDELEQVARLKAEVERLTKAGDAMAAVITEYRCSPWGNKVKDAFAIWSAWFAAKEGKGHE